MVGYDPDKHHRRSIRLNHYDYAQPGAYFVTMCIQHRLWLLGEIVDGHMICNDAGTMVARWWEKLPTKFANVTLGEYVVMPNHFHGIIHITPTHPDNEPVGATPWGRPFSTPRSRPTLSDNPTNVGTISQTSSTSNEGQRHGAAPTSPQSATLGEIIGWFKTMTTNEYIRGVKQLGWQPFYKYFWQRNYHEHVVRDDESLNAICNYIRSNPQNWQQDSENTTKNR